ncbi:hypothetical protein PMI29_06100 [Pseudomonas sp. GM49]|nr:hypothetical protein PMI29_06100 [Pseudomonas sp. GM49]
MVAGIWFQQMSESDLRRVIGPGGVLILLLPGRYAADKESLEVDASGGCERCVINPSETTIPCGSELARDEGLTFNTCVG